jgi:hypothetical protein
MEQPSPHHSRGGVASSAPPALASFHTRRWTEDAGSTDAHDAWHLGSAGPQHHPWRFDTHGHADVANTSVREEVSHAHRDGIRSGRERDVAGAGGIGAAWIWHLPWLLVLSLAIGGGETLETSLILFALRHGSHLVLGPRVRAA